MYVRVLQDELKFPEDRVLDQDTKSLIRGVSIIVMSKTLVLKSRIVAFTTKPCFTDKATSH